LTRPHFLLIGFARQQPGRILRLVPEKPRYIRATHRCPCVARTPPSLRIMWGIRQCAMLRMLKSLVLQSKMPEEGMAWPSCQL
jgi:hypothetical protein